MSSKISAVPILARRFLLSKVSDRFLSFIAWVSVVGVALGVLALVVVTSVINGFESELMRTITGMNGDLILYTRGDPLKDSEKIDEKIRKTIPEVQAVTSSFVTEMMASGPNGVAGAVVEGVDLTTLGFVTAIPKRMTAGRLPENDNEVTLGAYLAERIGAQVGTEVRLIAPFVADPGSEDGTSGSPRVLKAQVVGIVKMGMYDYDSKFVFATLPAMQKFLDQPARVTSFKIKLMPDSDTRAASDKLTDTFGYPFRAKDWGQLNKNLFYAIELEKAVIAIILTVIVIVAAFNVVSTLMMMIHDKTKEIAILKAMGFRASQSFALFCLIGMGIGLTGIAIGVVSGLGLNWVLENSRLLELPVDIYYIGKFPVIVKWAEVGVICLLAIVITFIATLFPAIKVSTRPPLDGLRYD